MSEEAFSVTFVGLFGHSLGFLSMFCTAIVVAGWSWTSISGDRARFHLLSTFLFQELDQVALDFTLTRLCCPPSAALSFAAFGGTELGCHLRLSAAIGSVRPPSAALGRQRRHSAAIGGTRQP
jgi:hypothetical protein